MILPFSNVKAGIAKGDAPSAGGLEDAHVTNAMVRDVMALLELTGGGSLLILAQRYDRFRGFASRFLIGNLFRC